MKRVSRPGCSSHLSVFICVYPCLSVAKRLCWVFHQLTFTPILDSFRVPVVSSKSHIAVLLLALASPATPAQDKLTPAEAKKLKSPVPNTKKSIAQGPGVFARYCT